MAQNKKKEQDKKNNHLQNFIEFIRIFIYVSIFPLLIFIWRRFLWPMIIQIPTVRNFLELPPEALQKSVAFTTDYGVKPLYGFLINVYFQVLILFIFALLISYAVYLTVKNAAPIRHPLFGQIRNPIIDYIPPLYLFKENQIFGFMDIFLDYLITNFKFASDINISLSTWLNSTVIVAAKGFGFVYEEECGIIDKEQGKLCPFGYVPIIGDNTKCRPFVPNKECEEQTEKRTHRERLLAYVKAQNEAFEKDVANLQGK